MKNATHDTTRDIDKLNAELFKRTRITRMKAIFVLNILIISFALTGCLNSSKTIYIRDSQGEAVKECMVLAVESNMLYPNQKGIFYSDDKGQVLIPYHGNVLYYAGKEQYKISLIASAEKQVDITIYNETQTFPDNTIVSKSIGVPRQYLSGATLTPFEINYFTSTSVITPLSETQ